MAGTIRLTSGALPAVLHPVTIDGTTAPGFAGTSLVEVDANGFGGLSFNAGSAHSALKSLGVVNASGDGVTLNAGSITVLGNYIGLLLSGEASGNSGNGLTINASSSGDIIGGTGTGGSNVISANAGNGVAINGAVNNVLINNFIGTDPTGTVPSKREQFFYYTDQSFCGARVKQYKFLFTTSAGASTPQSYQLAAAGTCLTQSTHRRLRVSVTATARASRSVLSYKFVSGFSGRFALKTRDFCHQQPETNL